MTAVAVLRASSRLSFRATNLPALNVSTGRLYYLSSGTRMFSNSTRTLQPVKELSVPEKSEPKTAGVEGPHRRDHTPTPTSLDAPPSLSTHTTGDWVLFHPVYTKEELNSVQVLQHERKTMSDKAAAWFVYALRKGFDLVSGYRHKDLPPNHESMSVADLRAGGYIMDPGQWLMRILFLETVAGVPGFTAAMIRHLRSLRVMRRDGGWIHMLLEEAENERMHLMTFMTLKEPSIWFRALILGAQGVFANAFFFSYLISPKTCHRFVGVLEEEATYTYTHLINDMEAGRVPEWSNMPAPSIAIDYWRLRPDATLLDVIYAVRSDETTHRFVNHTLANLNPKEDVNPFALGEPNMLVKGVKAGFSREEAAQYMIDNRKKAKEAGLEETGAPM